MESNIFYVIFFALVGSVFSLVGGMFLLAHRKSALKVAKYVTPFAAGMLLAAAFSDLLPEGAHEGDLHVAMYAALAGVLLFFVMERFLRWFHHRHDDYPEHEHVDPAVPLIIIGDTLHNFIDGVAIAAGFLVSVETGIVVTLAIAAHEIPQEIGDFGLLLHKGLKRGKVLLVNILSALAAVVSAVIFYMLGTSVELPLDLALGLVAGFFIYVAVSDIIPSIHHTDDNKVAWCQTVILVVGAVAMSIVITSMHGVIE